MNQSRLVGSLVFLLVGVIVNLAGGTLSRSEAAIYAPPSDVSYACPLPAPGELKVMLVFARLPYANPDPVPFLPSEELESRLDLEDPGSLASLMLYSTGGQYYPTQGYVAPYVSRNSGAYGWYEMANNTSVWVTDEFGRPLDNEGNIIPLDENGQPVTTPAFGRSGLMGTYCSELDTHGRLGKRCDLFRVVGDILPSILDGAATPEPIDPIQALPQDPASKVKHVILVVDGLADDGVFYSSAEAGGSDHWSSNGFEKMFDRLYRTSLLDTERKFFSSRTLMPLLGFVRQNCLSWSIVSRQKYMADPSAIFSEMIGATYPFCGNSRVDAPDEICDDGNENRGDGCSAGCQTEQALGLSAQKCVNGLNKRGFAVAKAQGKISLACLKASARGVEANAQSCLTADAGGKLAKVLGKTSATESAECATTPAFGYSSASAVNEAASGEVVALAADIFGNDLGTSVIQADTDANGAKCQAEVFKSALGLLDTTAKLFLGCKKNGLSGKSSPQMLSGSDLERCFDEVVSDADGKVQKANSKLVDGVIGRCSGLTAASVFPGQCGSASNLGSCIRGRVACRVCRMFNAMDGLAYDCDMFDNQSNDDSCP